MGWRKTAEVDAIATRERIVETAEGLFRRVGYSKTTVANIARQLDMSSANVYRYFPSKEHINEEICDRLMRGIAARCICAMDLDGNFCELIKSFILLYHRELAQSMLQNGRLYEMFRVAIQMNLPVIKSHSSRIENILSSFLEHGIAVGEFKNLDRCRMARAIHESVAVFTYPPLLEHWVRESADARQDDDIEGQLMFLLDVVLHGACV